MTKRNWPDYFEMYRKNIKYYNWWEFIQDWLEANIPKDVLDRLAPPICEKHEPSFYITVPSEIHCETRCKHCGAEIKPSGWELKT